MTRYILVRNNDFAHIVILLYTFYIYAIQGADPEQIFQRKFKGENALVVKL